MSSASTDPARPWHPAGQEDENLRQRLAFQLRRLTTDLDQLGHEFAARHGMHATDVRALLRVLEAARDGQSVGPGWLGTELNLTSASVTALVDRLERVGHLRRVRDTADRRRVVLDVGASAQGVGYEFFGPLNARMIAAMDDFGDDELAAIDRFLRRMDEIVVAYHAEMVAARKAPGDGPEPS